MLRLSILLWMGLAPAPAEAVEPAREPGPADEGEPRADDEPAVPEGEGDDEAPPDVGETTGSEDAEGTPSIRVMEREEAAALGLLPAAPPPVSEAPPRPPRVYPEIPIRARFELSAAFASSIIFHRSYLGFDDDRKLNAFELGTRLDFALGKRVFLGPVLGYRRSQTRGETYSNIYETDLILHEPTLGARLSVRPVDFLDVYVQAAGGPIVEDLRLGWNPDYADFDYEEEDLSGGGNATQVSVVGGGTAYLGAMVYLPKRALPRRGSSRATTGLDFGIGYALRAPVEVQPTRAVVDDPIDTQASSMGELRTSGLTWRLGAFVRFN